MLDAKYVLKNAEVVGAALARRSPDLDLSAIVSIGAERRDAVQKFETLRHDQKVLSAEFGAKVRSLSDADRGEMQGRLKALSEEVKGLEAEMKRLDEVLTGRLMALPNLPSAETPNGLTEDDNIVIRSWGTPRKGDELQDHTDIATALNIIDFEAGARISGARFVVYRGLGARLERALSSFMLDLHVDNHGYTEILPPFMVTRASMTGTGQLPKFEEDAFHCVQDDLFLIPTAEVPVTNLHRETIMTAEELPARYVAYSSCFRREAGSYGRDTTGLTRLHQFQKVEMVKLVHPDESAAAHEAMTAHAEAVLQALGLPYRVIELCAGDLGFAAKRCYDIEVWLSGQNQWREISSCSNMGDFQARRASIRFRPAPKEKPRFVHTLNGSGLAVGRTVMALIEHYQQADGSIAIPEALQPYMRVPSIPAPA